MQQKILLSSAAVGALLLVACDGTSTRFADPVDAVEAPDEQPMDPMDPMEQAQLRDFVLNEINTRTRADTLPAPVNNIEFDVDDTEINLDLVNAM